MARAVLCGDMGGGVFGSRSQRKERIKENAIENISTSGGSRIGEGEVTFVAN